MNRVVYAFLFAALGTNLFGQTPQGSGEPDFHAALAPLLTKYCVGCHHAEDAEGGLSLEAFNELMKGGKGGAI